MTDYISPFATIFYSDNPLNQISCVLVITLSTLSTSLKPNSYMYITKIWKNVKLVHVVALICNKLHMV